MLIKFQSIINVHEADRFFFENLKKLKNYRDVCYKKGGNTFQRTPVRRKLYIQSVNRWFRDSNVQWNTFTRSDYVSAETTGETHHGSVRDQDCAVDRGVIVQRHIGKHRSFTSRTFRQWFTRRLLVMIRTTILVKLNRLVISDLKETIVDFQLKKNHLIKQRV